MDKPRQLSLGVSAKTEMAEWDPWAPPNFVAETTDTQLVVMGPAAAPAGNKTYYRVVAVDERDQRSGPSDYAVAPRPVIYSKPSVTAKVGKEYKYTVRANRSLGDLTHGAKTAIRSAVTSTSKSPVSSPGDRLGSRSTSPQASSRASRTQRAGGSNGHRHHRPAGAETGRKKFGLGPRERALHSPRTRRHGHAEFVIEIQ